MVTNRQDARRDGRAETRETEAYLKQYVEVTRVEPARLAAKTCSQACRSGVSAVAVEAIMNNVGYEDKLLKTRPKRRSRR
jgi:hypothetical protein